MKNKQAIKNSWGKILGFIEEDEKGNKVATNSYGKLLGRYNKSANITTNSYGKLLYRGDFITSLLPRE